MINIEKRKLMLGAACVFAGTAAALATKGVMAVTSPKSVSQNPHEQMRSNYLPNVPLVTHQGREVRFYDDLIKDKKVVINFMYTGCKKTCLPSIHNINEARQLLGEFARDVHFYSISLTPLSDTPEVLRDYMKAREIGEGWTFLTGKWSEIDQVRRGLGFTSDDPAEDANPTSHAGMLRIYDDRMLTLGHASTLTSGKTIARMIRYELG